MLHDVCHYINLCVTVSVQLSILWLSVSDGGMYAERSYGEVEGGGETDMRLEKSSWGKEGESKEG